MQIYAICKKTQILKKEWSKLLLFNFYVAVSLENLRK